MIKIILSITKPIRYWYDRISFAGNNNVSLEKLKNIYQDKPLLIIGNGPSLNETPLDEFIKVPAIGLNKIELIFSRVQWRPQFIVCMNNLVVKQYWEKFVTSEIPTFISWKARWFVKKKYRKSLKYFLSNATPDFSKDITNGIGSAGTVTYTALQFAYYMGANPVILFGVDHTFNFQGDPADLAKRKGEDINHFDPNYFKEGQWWGLPNLDLSEVGYLNAKKAFENDGRTVLDATIGGKLNIFEKISLEKAREICGI